MGNLTLSPKRKEAIRRQKDGLLDEVRRDYRDDTIEQLADDLSVMTDRAHVAESLLDGYKLVTRQLLATLHIAVTDPEAWPRRVSRHREATIQLTREAIRQLHLTVPRIADAATDVSITGDQIRWDSDPP